MPSVLRTIRSALSRTMLLCLWPVGFLLLGFVPTFLLATPIVGMALAIAAIIPFGSKSPSPLRSIVRGLVLGGSAGLGIVAGLGITREGSVPGHYKALYIGATMLICTAASALFYHLARRRQRLIDKHWE